MKRRADCLLTLAIISLLSAAAPQAFSAQVNAAAAKQFQELLQAMPDLEYPAAALARHTTGHGLFDIWFRTDTGVVTRVKILRSTGSKLLDDAAIRGFSRWRAKPHKVSHMHIPVSFVM